MLPAEPSATAATPCSSWADQIRSRGEAATLLRERAGTCRDTVFGRRVFVRAVIELSNFCRQNCNYCGIRRDNRQLERRDLPLDLLRKIVLEDLPASVTDINLQAGENPRVIETALTLIREIRQQTRLGISLGLGTLEQAHYDALREAGASFYVLKVETGDPQHYREVQAPGDLARRVEAIRYLAQTGWHVSSGLIYGLPGQTPETLTTTFRLLETLPLAGTSVSPYIPGEETPFQGDPSADIQDTLNCVASLRLAFPQRIIPAVSAMRLLKKSAYAEALRAGANLVTINLTPDEWTNGYPIYSQNRTVIKETMALESIAEAGLTPSQQGITDFLNAHRPHSSEADPA
jgi:biotin synthase